MMAILKLYAGKKLSEILKHHNKLWYNQEGDN